ncbi:hypothetical protein [Lacticaseibacillus songhuajiangensis]|jgi:hypothetical protein|uniref:hypothetical protein n=1 Tax=Lacticaseibacillus songhuajiangensis TaxID=1296539 RepID=UPI000F7BAB73|nr:hypothetical protein [Lacticaseibacillus songhuajiangensis]MCI1284247.1 hypothetical protein [Lacticaseibacillus songhuajiangensis]
MALTAAQKAAQKRYREKNRERQRYYVAKSTAMRFVEMASDEDFAQLCVRIARRQQGLDSGDKLNG